MLNADAVPGAQADLPALAVGGVGAFRKMPSAGARWPAATPGDHFLVAGRGARVTCSRLHSSERLVPDRCYTSRLGAGRYTGCYTECYTLSDYRIIFIFKYLVQ